MLPAPSDAGCPVLGGAGGSRRSTAAGAACRGRGPSACGVIESGQRHPHWICTQPCFMVTAGRWGVPPHYPLPAGINRGPGAPPRPRCGTRHDKPPPDDEEHGPPRSLSRTHHSRPAVVPGHTPCGKGREGPGQSSKSKPEGPPDTRVPEAEAKHPPEERGRVRSAGRRFQPEDRRDVGPGLRGGCAPMCFVKLGVVCGVCRGCRRGAWRTGR